MDDDIYTADGQPHIPSSLHNQEVLDQGSSNNSLNAIDSLTNLSKTLPNNPPISRAPYRTYNSTENVGQEGSRGIFGGGDSGSSLTPEFRKISDHLISSVPGRVSSSLQNHSNDLSYKDLAVTAGQGENSLRSTNYQFKSGNRPMTDLSNSTNQPLGSTSNLSFEPTDEWQAELSRRMDGLQISARNGIHKGLTSSRSSTRNDGLVGTRSAQTLVEGDLVMEAVHRTSSSTDSESAGGESSGQTVAPRKSNSRIVRFSQDVQEVILPRWQPDAEVTYCPICHTQFSFFVRKHHCRRCGRVVCNACSPHRITIPYQFIVQPPAAIPAVSATVAAHLESHRDGFVEDVTSNFADRNGGMKVRLCNPCVPDPNPLPPQQFLDETGPPTLYLTRGNILTRENRPRPYVDELSSSNLGRIRGMSAASALRASDPATTFANNRPGLISPMAPPFAHSRPVPPNAPSRGYDVSASSRNRSPYPSSPVQSGRNRGHGTRLHHQSLSFTPGASALNLQPHYRSLLDVGSNHTRTLNSADRPLPPAPRLDEDDMCPICHRALPSRTFPDFEDRRVAHVTQCIDEQLMIHSGQASRPAAYTSRSQPAPEVSNHHSPQPQHQPSPLIPLSTPESHSVVGDYNNFNPNPNSAPITHPGRRTGMFVYLASEKDCVDDAECTICLEEFVVGAQMARLECFCRFHKKCIGDWFVDHPGRCPMHSHDSFGF